MSAKRWLNPNEATESARDSARHATLTVLAVGLLIALLEGVGDKNILFSGKS